MSPNFSSDLILVTCASGKQCKYLVPILAAKWKRLRLQVNSSASKARLQKQFPNAEVIQADLANSVEVPNLMKGVTSVYHVGPSFHPHETSIAYSMIDAAVQESKTGQFQHFVLSSVLNSQFRKMLNHDCKRYEEEYLMESGLAYTILQPAHFMDTFPVGMLMAQEAAPAVYKANWDPDIPFSFVSTKDLSAAAAKVLEDREKHFYAVYPLVSVRNTTYRQKVDIVSQVLGKEIKVEQRSFEESVQALLAMLGMGKPNEVDPRVRDAAERMLLFYNRRGLLGNENVLTWLLGREPTGHEEWVKGEVEAINGK
jgi:uncharacterized protein YbjT (DUF2867 family)